MWSNILSIFRIFATTCIFTYHILGQYDFPTYHLEDIAIVIFCFLSGYFSPRNCDWVWLKQRVLGVMIPYWLVIIPVLIVNKFFSYKEVTIISQIITLFGGNLFLDEPVYVIAWYVTFVLLLYLFTCIQTITSSMMLRIVLWIVGYIVLYINFNLQNYFIAFGVGFVFEKICPIPSKRDGSIFWIQGRCYHFFLVHGGFIVFLKYYSHFDMVKLLILSAILSCIGAVLLEKMSSGIRCAWMGKIKVQAG